MTERKRIDRRESAMATETAEAAGDEGPRASARTLPLNSRRLTASIVNRIAKELGVTGTASLEDLRQIVEGQVEELGHSPPNVRVELVETDRGVVVSLQDDKGTFLECEPEVERERGADYEDGGAIEGRDVAEGGGYVADAVEALGTHRVAELEAEVSRLTEEKAMLLGEVSSLRDKVQGEKCKYNNLWRESCEQMREYDSTMADKEAEIEALKSRIAAMEAGVGPDTLFFFLHLLFYSLILCIFTF